MFLRRMRRRILILHSYRDGRGKVCQRRLGHFTDLAGLERELDDLPRRCPDLYCDGPRLRDRARKLLHDQPPGRQPSENVSKALRTLLNWLTEELDPGQLSPDLATLRARLQKMDLDEANNPLSQARSALPSRRKRFDPSDDKAQAYLEALEQLAKLQQQPEEKARILGQRVQACPDPRALLQYGATLQQLGHHEEAIEQYQRVPDQEGSRHYNLSSTYWQLGDFEQALVHLLRGIARQPETAEALFRMQQGKCVLRGGGYWEEFGELWDRLGRRFLVAISRIPLVRRRVRQAQQSQRKVRSLVPPSSRVWMLQRGLAEVP